LSLNLKKNDIELIQVNLSQILNEKEEKIFALKQELMSIKKAHARMLEEFTKKMNECFIPIEELGFPVQMPNMTID
jgi:hypothetical protein